MLLPHLEIIQKELFIAWSLLNKDTHLSNVESLIDLAVKLEIHIQVMESVRDRWNKGLEVILATH